MRPPRTNSESPDLMGARGRMPAWFWYFMAALAVLGIGAGVGIVLSTRSEAGTAADDNLTPRPAPSEPGVEATEGGPSGGDDGFARVVDCDVAEPPVIPGLDISVDSMSRAQETAIGESYLAEVLAYYPASSDSATESDLQDLLDELAPTIDGIDFDVTLLDSSEVNAFALPGGSLFFTTAIVDVLDDDELAFVMAHEIAHVECRHSAQQLEREALAVAAVEAVLGDAVDADSLYESTTGQGVAFLANLSFSRADEQEADLRALDLMEHAGRSTGAAAGALRVLLDYTVEPASDMEVWLSTHPPTAERIENVEAAA